MSSTKEQEREKTDGKSIENEIEYSNGKIPNKQEIKRVQVKKPMFANT